MKDHQVIKKLNEQMNSFMEKNKKRDNFMILKIKITKEDLRKEIRIINQCSTYKLFKNFERDDIDVELNGVKIYLRYKSNSNDSSDCLKYIQNSVDTKESEEIFKICGNNNYQFFWIFDTEGIYTFKIIFKKKLISCAGMFYKSENLTEIDISKFDCSNVLSCNSMFWGCDELRAINLGKLDFASSRSFKYMFYYCSNVTTLDVTNFDTRNSKSFYGMFSFCSKIKKIDVSKFNSSKCEDISCMFSDCNNLNEIDMISWDMSNLRYTDGNNPISYLFDNCKKLTRIKISGNLKEEVARENLENPFGGIPESGELVTSKKVKCKIPLDGYLPQNWSRNKE